jgi:Flp pilus assembly protein TadG
MFGFGRRKAADSRRGGGFLSRLARDSRGNTLAIVGAALIPLTAMIGSGVDMSRAYMAKTRLQVACDAAALAGRRVMQNDTLDANVTSEATRFFNYNFNQGMYSTTAFTPAVTRPATGTVRVSASTNIPTSVMRIFGFTTLPLSVTCDAKLDVVNTDVMLVLDTTGSMDNDVNDNSTNVDANRKITALRSAVMALYDQLKPVQDQLAAQNLRLRYGVVPYSSSVNVGQAIRDMDPSYLVDSATYQSRVVNYNTMSSSSTAPGTAYWEYYTATAPYYTSVMANSSSITQGNCQKFMANTSFTGFSPTTNPVSGGPPPTATVNATYPTDGTATAGGSSGEWGYTGAPVTSGTSRSCRRLRQDSTTNYFYTYTDDSYRPVTYDTSQYKAFNPVTLAIADNGHVPTATSGLSSQTLPGSATGESTRSVTWNGCIEERDTTSTITGSTTTIPSSAFDLDINRIPTNDNTRWRPMWPDLVYFRTAGSTSATSGTWMLDLDSNGAIDTNPLYQQFYACPAQAHRMAIWARADLQTYVNGLTPSGSTYHDIGMIWGARMISHDGAFGPDNPNLYNGVPVARYLIFMTDGQLAPTCTAYSAYGIEQNDMRVTGSGSCPNQFDRHMARFKMVCNAARGMGFSVWVIAFGTTLTSDMQACASNANQASTAADSATLIARFREIGANIGALRLTQ